MNRLSIWVFMLSFLSLSAASQSATPACVTVSHELAEGCAAPGEEALIAVTISSDCDPSVAALGLREQIPDNWLLKGVSGNAPPEVHPAADTSGTLEFAWVDVPAFPVSFTYRVLIPQAKRPQAFPAPWVPPDRAGLVRVTTRVSVCLKEVAKEGEGGGTEGEVRVRVRVKEAAGREGEGEGERGGRGREEKADRDGRRRRGKKRGRHITTNAPRKASLEESPVTNFFSGRRATAIHHRRAQRL